MMLRIIPTKDHAGPQILSHTHFHLPIAKVGRWGYTSVL